MFDAKFSRTDPHTDAAEATSVAATPGSPRFTRRDEAPGATVRCLFCRYRKRTGPSGEGAGASPDGER